MAETAYRDLVNFGLRLVAPDDSSFASLVADIRSRTLGPWPQIAGEAAAVLLNESGKSIIALAVIWRFTDVTGNARTGRVANLGSSMQMDVLAGRAKVTRDRFSFILPGSKRLITDRGVFGDNSDVLPPETPAGGGFVMGGGGGGRRGNREVPWKRIELQLDIVFFEDGLCVGPDESGLFVAVASELEQQRTIAAELAAAMRSGASAGRLFEMLQPFARPPRPDSASDRPERFHRPYLLVTFARMAIDRLINQTGQEILAWLDWMSAPSQLPLHRAGEGGT